MVKEWNIIICQEDFKVKVRKRVVKVIKVLNTLDAERPFLPPCSLMPYEMFLHTAAMSTVMQQSQPSSANQPATSLSPIAEGEATRPHLSEVGHVQNGSTIACIDFSEMCPKRKTGL
eukprot:2894982-Amphidinium_carterae.1